eukprot:scaffold13377_cov61-Phaeocystis_antarctica.AAC.9
MQVARAPSWWRFGTTNSQRSTMQAARLRTLSRAVPARLGVLPAVQHGARELCTGLPKEGEEGCGAVTPLPPWRHRNKKIVARSTGVLACREARWHRQRLLPKLALRRLLSAPCLRLPLPCRRTVRPAGRPARTERLV